MDFGMDLQLAYIHCATDRAQFYEKVIHKIILCKDSFFFIFKTNDLIKACSNFKNISIMWRN